MYTHALCFLVLTLSLHQTAHCQLLADTVFTWQGYSRPGICGLLLYKNSEESSKAYTVVLIELGENEGPATTTEIGYLAEHIGRRYNFDPTRAYWIIHWGSFSYRETRKSKKELFIRVTFNRTSTNRIGAPQWRIIRKQDVEKYTDRQYLKWKGL